jgi:hypothetical protein
MRLDAGVGPDGRPPPVSHPALGLAVTGRLPLDPRGAAGAEPNGARLPGEPRQCPPSRTGSRSVIRRPGCRGRPGGHSRRYPWMRLGR